MPAPVVVISDNPSPVYHYTNAPDKNAKVVTDS